MQNKPNPFQLPPGQLKALYPYQFAGAGVQRLGFARGWMPFIVEMCHEVDALMRDRLDLYSFTWVQFKEKFGVPQFVYRLRVLSDESGDEPESQETLELRQRLQAIRLKAEMQARTLCMACGQQAQLVDTPRILTLCQQHEDIHRRGGPLGAYLDDEGRDCELPLHQERVG